VLLLLAAARTGAAAQTGDPQAGKALWDGQTTLCRQCHGAKGEGGFGPDLAGRRLSGAQFKQAVRKPWGIMPAFTEQQISDRDIAHLVAYFESLPAGAEPGPWRTPLPPGAPARQALLIASVGCGQCHGPVLGNPRAHAGGINADFAWFAKMVYEHTTEMPGYRTLIGEAEAPLRMGNYSRVRLPETILQEIWQYVKVDAGFRVLIRARLSPAGHPNAAAALGAPGGPASNGSDGVTYTLTVENGGLAGKGLTAEGVSLSLTLPSGSTVANTSGTGYQGVRRDSKTGLEMAVWQLSRMAPTDKQSFTITLSGSGASARVPGGTVSWVKPALKDGTSDSVNIALPPPPGNSP